MDDSPNFALQIKSFEISLLTALLFWLFGSLAALEE